MITRLLENKDSITKSLSSHKHSLQLLTEADWVKLSTMQKLLIPCEKVCTFLGGEQYSTISVVLPIFAFLKKEMTSSDDDPGYAKKFKDGMYVDLVTRLDKIQENAVLQIATALDIRFKSLKCIAKESRAGVWNLLERLMNDVQLSEAPAKVPRHTLDKGISIFAGQDSDSDEDISHVENEVGTELHLYKSIRCEEDVMKDPLQYWAANESSFPRLSVLAKCYLALPATSVPVERLFSTSGEIISRKRNSILPEHADMLLCVHS